MSRLRLWPLLMLSVGSGGVLAAQDASTWRDSAQRLSASVRALRDSLLESDSTVSEVGRHNGLAIGASGSKRETAVRAFAEFEQQRARWFDEALPSPDGFRIVIRIVASRSFGRFGSEQVRDGQVVLTGLPDIGSAARAERVIWNEPLGRTLLDAYAPMMVASLPARAARWLDRPIPFSLEETERRYLVMYAVMTGAGRAERGCANGKLADCAYLLNLREPVTPDPGGRYPESVRADLLLNALESGGPGAWQRFADPNHPNAEAALAAAAGVQADTLLSRWRSSILALRPDTAPLHLSAGLIAVGWTALLLATTLGASRWP